MLVKLDHITSYPAKHSLQFQIADTCVIFRLCHHHQNCYESTMHSGRFHYAKPERLCLKDFASNNVLPEQRASLKVTIHKWAASVITEDSVLL